MLFRKGCGIRFERAELREEMKDCPNPGRGWYRLYSFSAEEEIREEELQWCLKKEERLALVMVDLGGFREEPLTKEALAHIERIFAFFKKYKKEMILRFVYDREGRGMEREPATMELIQTHMQQLGRLIRAYEKEIFLIQGLFVGSWGEMHSSRYLSRECLRELADTLCEETAVDCFFSLRKPVFWRMLFGKEEKGRGLRKKMGFFNDGLLASATDLGTYGTADVSNQDWESAWSREAELRFQEELCRHVPNGGEAVGEDALGDFSSALRCFEQMHITYLNSVYDERVLNRWKRMEYRGVSGYDYIGMHLGYRLVIKDVVLNKKKGVLKIKIENKGFAGLYERAEAYVYFRKGEQVCHRQKIPISPGSLESKKSTEIQAGLPELEKGDYQICLQFKRQKDERVIRFANIGAQEEIYLGLLRNV